MRLHSLRAAWKRAPWMRRLSGLTSPPSTLALGAEQWIASLRASRASRTAKPEAARVSRTNAGYGPTLQELFASLVHGSWCSKTLQGSFLPADSLPYSQTWPRWGSMRNGECYLREAWVPATGASECSSWATPNAHDGRRPGVDDKSTQGGNLQRDAATWATPDCNTSTYSNGTMGPNIRQQTAHWTTPQAHDVTARGLGQQPSAAAGNACLARDAMTWPTPRSTDGPKGGPNQAGSKGDLMLPSFTAHWPTPAARIAKGGGNAMNRVDGKSRMDMLDWAAESYSRPDPTTKDGPTSSPNVPTSRPRLNPAFVCWLLGLPPAWTNIEHTSFDAAEMASYRSRLQRRLSCLLTDSDSRSKAA